MLTAEHMHLSFGEQAVLRDAEFSIARREIVSLSGASGSGKSSLARVICGSVLLDSGEVRFMGDLLASAKAYNKNHRRELQLIPQQPYDALDPRQKALDAVMEPLIYHQIKADRADAQKRASELFDRVGLSRELYSRRPSELSGGQAQRVLIARALTLSPALLIADEATSMLDVSTQAEIVRLFRSLVEEDGISLLFISHDDTLSDSLADRSYRLSDGVLIEE